MMKKAWVALSTVCLLVILTKAQEQPSSEIATLPPARGVYYQSPSGWTSVPFTLLVPSVNEGGWTLWPSTTVAEVKSAHSQVRISTPRPTLYLRGISPAVGIYLVREIQKNNLRRLRMNLARDDHEKARYHQDRALHLNPNNDLILVQNGELLTWLGRPEDGIEWIKKAMRLNPYHPERYWSHLGRAHFTARQYAETVQALSRLTRPDHTHHAYLAAALAQLGDKTAATAHAQAAQREVPTFSIERFLSTLHYQQDSDRDHLREGLVKAGFGK